MRKEFKDCLFIAAPALFSILLGVALSLPGLVVAMLGLSSAFAASLVRLGYAHLALRTQGGDNLAFTTHVIDMIPHPVYVKDADSRYVIVNRAFCEERGLPVAEIIGKTTQDIARDKKDSGISRAEDLAVLAGKTIRMERHDRHPVTGGERHRMIMKGACQTSRGESVIVGANFDISRWWITEQDLQHELRRERTFYQDTLAFVQRVIDLIPYPVYVKNAQGQCFITNRAMADEIRLENDNGTLEEQAAAADEDRAVLAGGTVFREAREVLGGGQERVRLVSKGSCPDTKGEAVIVGVHVDVTNLRLAERNLQQALQEEVALRERTHAFIQRLIDVIPDPIFIKKAGGRYEMINEAFAQYRQVNKLTWKGFDLSQPSFNDNRPTTLREDDEVLAGAEVEKEDHTFRKHTGEEIFRIISKRRSIYVDGDPVVVGVERHITQWRIAERELKRLAEEDTLTGIANRRHFNIEAQRALELAHRHNEQLSILMFDLDHFKLINDQYGHNVGDEVLREMSRRMRECFRKSDLPGRWGGEEFIALLPHTSIVTAQQVAERLRSQLADQPVATGGGEVHVTVSAGGAQRCNGDTLESLLARADTALYSAKHGGRNRVEIDLQGVEQTALDASR